MTTYSPGLRLAVLLIATSLCLEAGILTLTDVDWTRGGMVPFRQDGVAVTEYAGAILGTYNGISVSPLMCVDLFTGISIGTYTSTTVSPRASRNEDRVAWLFINYVGLVNDAIHGEALQLAIWDIIHDSGNGPNSGRVRRTVGQTPTAVRTAWSEYLTWSLGQSTNQATIYLSTDSNGVPVQALISAGVIAENEEPGAPAPEPVVWALTGVGLIALPALRRFFARF